MNLRKSAFFLISGIRGQHVARYYRWFQEADQREIPADTVEQALIQLLTHCAQHVPYYAKQLKSIGASYHSDPLAYLHQMPILTKKIIRESFHGLISDDLCVRKWYYNTSGGSTGEPVLLVQDWDFAARTGAIKFFYSKLVGREIGEREVVLWGSSKDIDGCTQSLSARLSGILLNSEIWSVFRLTPEYMRSVLQRLSRRPPRLIVGYASALYELARFAQHEQIDIAPQKAIISSAYTLHPIMRQSIEQAFSCRVYDRYGSREVGDIACERPGYPGIWVMPWGTYIEIVDQSGNPVPDGERGQILVTCLSNYAMPMIRYNIGDVGALSPQTTDLSPWKGQFLQGVIGRSNDDFINQDGTLVDTGYFKLLLYFREWIAQYQIIQKQPDLVVFLFVTRNGRPPENELQEIARKSRQIMGADCDVRFEFVSEILPSTSGKYRYIISEVAR